jgi:hypothetical protein
LSIEGRPAVETAEQVKMVNNDAGANEPRFWLSAWPTDPAPRIGEPIVGYVSGHELRALGWSPQLIQDHLGQPDGTRRDWRSRFSFITKRLYRLDRVLRVEQDDEFQAALAKVRRRRAARTGQEVVIPPRPAPLPLALDVAQLKARGWGDLLIEDFLPTPDGFDRRGDRNFRLYAATRVEQAEATSEFREAWERHKKWEAEYRARREAEEAEREAARAVEREREAEEHRERQEREWQKGQALRTAFPGFCVEARVFRKGWGGEVTIDGQAATAAGPEFCALVRGCREALFWTPLVDWLLEHPDVGPPKFRTALKFLAAGDPDGWDAYIEENGTPDEKRSLEFKRSFDHLRPTVSLPN